jgi:hypothetical protein
MSADIAHELQAKGEERVEARSTRVRLVLGMGPATALAGAAWALLQPWRLTLLHPHGQGFWWLLAEPPLYVALVGVLFRWVIAPGLVADLEADE